MKRISDRERRERVIAELWKAALLEADPKRWPGHGRLDQLDDSTLRRRYWTKKQPAATLAVLTRLQYAADQADARTARGMEDPMPNRLLDEELAAAEREAAEILKRMQAGGRFATPSAPAEHVPAHEVERRAREARDRPTAPTGKRNLHIETPGEPRRE